MNGGDGGSGRRPPVDRPAPTAKTPAHSKPPGRTSLWIAAAGAAVAVGMLGGGAVWPIVAIAAAGTFAAAKVLSRDHSDDLRVRRIGGDVEVAIGSRVPMRLEVRNVGRWPIAWLLVEDLTPIIATHHDARPAEIEGDRLGVFWLSAGSSRELEYTLHCQRRGYIQIGPAVVEGGDWFGFYRRFRVAAGPTHVTVLPRVRSLDRYDVGSRRPIGEIRVRRNVQDDPTRLRGIRRWQRGDPLRRIHWSATARTGELHSKEYEPSSMAGATVVLDLHHETNPRRHQPARIDLAIDAAASVLARLHDDGQPFAVATNGRDAADRLAAAGDVGDVGDREEIRRRLSPAADNDRVRPVVTDVERTTVHYRECLRTLARLEGTDGLFLSDMIAECESRLSSDTTLMFFVHEPREADVAAIISLHRRGRAVSVVFNVPADETPAGAGAVAAAGVEVRRLTDERSIADLCGAAVM